MKNLAFIIVFMLIVSNINSQTRANVVAYYNWSNPISYNLSSSPIVTGYSFLSDSLAKAHNDSTFYEYNGEYYPITCWADYYLWYVKKYWYYFNQPELYEYYYWTGDDYGMAGYICNNNYTGPEYPSRIAVSFHGRDIYCNNLSSNKIKHNIKSNTWNNKNYIAVDEIEKNKIRKSPKLELVKEENNNSLKTGTKKYVLNPEKNGQANREINNSKSKQNNYKLDSNRNNQIQNSNTKQSVNKGTLSGVK